MKAGLAVAPALLLAWSASAQERQRGACEITIGRGAAQGGAQATMQVESGRSCGTAAMRRPDRGEPTASLSLASPPAHGQVTITQPNRFEYTPAPGFVGDDRFTISGQPSPYRITVTVTVLPPGRARR